MNILFVLENYYPHIGGVETLFKALAESLVKNGHRVTVFTSRVIENAPRSETIEGVTIKRFWSGNRYIFTFLSIFSVLKLAKQNDIIHTTSYNAALPAWLAAKISGKKCIITFHEVWMDLWQRLPYMSAVGALLHKWFEAFLLKRSFDAWIGVSDFTAQRLKQYVPNPGAVHRIYNGLDYTYFEQILAKNSYAEIGDFTFMYYGRLGVSKGLDLLVPAIADAREKGYAFSVRLVVPQIPLEMFHMLTKNVEQHGIEDIVSFQHSLPFDELCEQVVHSDAVIIPSYSEGFCFVAAETVALGTAIISSGQGALKETVQGRYIEMQEHSIEGLSLALCNAMDGKWSYKKPVRFKMQDAVSAYEAIFKSMTS